MGKLQIEDILGQHPADIAKLLEGLPEEEILEIFHRLPPELAGEVLDELRPRLSAELVSHLDRSEAGEILEEMDPDDAVDVMERLTSLEREELLQEMGVAEAEVIKELIGYPPDTAGGIMSPEVVALSLDLTVEEAVQELRRRAEAAETIYYAYVVGEENRLQGVLSMRDLIISDSRKRLEEIMIRDVLSVQVTVDREEVARLFDRYNYLALPVIDEQNHLLGIITVDDVVDVIRAEATEDMHRMVGVAAEERVFSPLRASVRRRLPWLYVNLATAFLAATVVGLFESTIAKITVLAVFMPIIAGMGGNTGAQTVTVIVRGLALGEIKPGEGKRVLLKEAVLGVVYGLAIGTVVAVVAYLWKGSPLLGLIICMAMILNLIIAAIAGVMIPLTLRFLGVDPALASTIFLTTVTDVCGFLFFLGLATLFLLKFPGFLQR